jgi:hypothetical protein
MYLVILPRNVSKVTSELLNRPEGPNVHLALKFPPIRSSSVRWRFSPSDRPEALPREKVHVTVSRSLKLGQTRWDLILPTSFPLINYAHLSLCSDDVFLKFYHVQDWPAILLLEAKLLSGECLTSPEGVGTLNLAHDPSDPSVRHLPYNAGYPAASSKFYRPQSWEDYHMHMPYQSSRVFVLLALMAAFLFGIVEGLPAGGGFSPGGAAVHLKREGLGGDIGGMVGGEGLWLLFCLLLCAVSLLPIWLMEVVMYVRQNFEDSSALRRVDFRAHELYVKTLLSLEEFKDEKYKRSLCKYIGLKFD